MELRCTDGHREYCAKIRDNVLLVGHQCPQMHCSCAVVVVKRHTDVLAPAQPGKIWVMDIDRASETFEAPIEVLIQSGHPQAVNAIAHLIAQRRLEWPLNDTEEAIAVFVDSIGTVEEPENKETE